MPVTLMNDAVTIGWFGKLPCAGDFAYRRLPVAIKDEVDSWLRAGMFRLRTTCSDWRTMYEQAPMWNCAVPAFVTTSSMTLIALIAPSRDRVGREFPLCAGVWLPPETSAAPLLSTAHTWLSELGRLVASTRSRPMTIDLFDDAVQSIELPSLEPAESPADGAGDILSVISYAVDDVPTVPMPLANALPWPELPTTFDAAGPTSYWWTNTGNGGALRGFTSEAGLAPSLVVTLLQSPFGLMPRRS